MIRAQHLTKRYGKFTAKCVTAHCEIEGETVHQVSGVPWATTWPLIAIRAQPSKVQ